MARAFRRINVPEVLTLREALAIMRKVDERGYPIPFSIKWCTLDQQRGTGGMLKELKKARMSGHERKRAEELERPRKRTQYHYQNQTRNIVDLQGDITKVHIQLIVRINGIRVL